MRSAWLVRLSLLLTAAPLRAQCPDGTPPPCGRRAPPATAHAPAHNSVAVLYFESLSRDTSDAYLADGLTEEITASLGGLGSLLVKSPSAVRRAQRAGSAELRTVGRALAVYWVVEGSVRRAGDQLRVVVRLVDAENETARWSNAFTRPMADLLSIQEEIARQVASGVAGALAPVERARLATLPTRDPVAYEHYLRGNFELGRRTSLAIARGIAEYEAALRSDTSFTAARARLSFAFQLLAGDYYEPTVAAPRESLLVRGFEAADRALHQDSSSSEAWMALAALRSLRYPQTYEGVREAFDRALAFNPRNGEAYHLYGVALFRLGDDSAAERMLHRALAIDAERPITLWNLGYQNHLRRRFAEALRWFDSALTFQPEAAFYWDRRPLTRLQLGDTAGARADAVTLAQRGRPQAAEGVFALLEVKSGDTVAARRRVAALASGAPLFALAAIGDADSVVARLQRSPLLDRLWSDLRAPEFDPVRHDRRFQRIFEEARPVERRR